MMRLITGISTCALLTACGDGQPFFEVDEGTVPDVQIELDGTENPEASNSISRIEPGQVTEDGRLIANENGGGLVRSVSYDADTDTYSIDNLAFDGDEQTPFTRSTVFPTLGGYPIFAAAINVPDSVTSAPIDQIAPYIAITGRSAVINPEGSDGEFEPRTTFAVVRTGGYADFGFGGFVYARNGDVILQTEGQAEFVGQYTGVRVSDPRGGLEYTTGDAKVAFDFDDFNLNNGVKGIVDNRQLFDEDGVEIPLFFGTDDLLKNLEFVVLQGVDTLLPTGEMTGEVVSVRLNESGITAPYEIGNYYAILAGDLTTATDGGELVGVIVVESEDPRFEGVTVQESGGFLLPRAQP